MTSSALGARPGDLLAFVGHTGMEPAVGLLRERLAATGRRGRRLAASFVDADDQIRTSTGRSPGTGTPPKGQP